MVMRTTGRTIPQPCGCVLRYLFRVHPRHGSRTPPRASHYGEDVYLKGYADGREAARGIAEWVAFYNDRRPHQALADRMPMAVWREAIVGARAVDMMDNASALPTCPQPQQQTQPLAA